MKDLIKLKKFNLKYIHIGLIILGIIFISLSAFHTNLWFDEAYSVGIANYSFKDIWIVGGTDVHPVLYYCLLHILNLIFGNNVLIYRLFAVLCTSILGIIGFTHIRKDFGEKVGLLFSFFVFFFPASLAYSSEIRMYSLAMLLVTLMAIYAYRIYKNSEDFSVKNWIIFAICSLASAYTHYYALMTSGLINLFLMIALINQCVKGKKFNNNMKAFIVSAIIQILLYIPWLVSLLFQVNKVSNGFWISFSFPYSVIELFTFIFTGNLDKMMYINYAVALVWSLALTIYIVALYINKTKNNYISSSLEGKKNPAILALAIFLCIILAACIVSVVIRRPIIYARYLLCVMGLFIFFLAYTMANRGQKYINLIVCTISLLISLYINIDFINVNYDESNYKPIEFVKEEIKDDDIILVENDINAFIIIVNLPNNNCYFYDRQNWYSGESYKAFSKNLKTVYDLDFLENYKGRIWTINHDSNYLYDQIDEKYDVNLIKQEMFDVKYKNLKYSISLIEKT